MIPLRDTIPSSRFPLVTLCLIGVNVLAFLAEISLSTQALDQFFQHWGIVPLRFTHPRLQANYFTLLSSMFMHGGWMHIIFNMWSLWIFGDNVEDRLGRAGFFLFYMLSGLAAGAVHIVTNPLSTVPTVGASGAIAGVMGAYLLLFPHATVVTLIPIFFFIQIVELPAVFFLGFWFLAQLFSGTLSLAAAGAQQAGGVAWWAHIGGFVVGFLWAVPLRRRTGIVRRRKRY
ncbi:MAG: rhomboid family intramembrane serine protease [bacterium]|nr:rhomboid family intramembrane serine protease [bacterium]